MIKRFLVFICYIILITPLASFSDTTKELTVVGLGYKHFGSVTNIRINFILNNKGMVQCGLYHKGSLLVMSERITEKPAVGTVLIPSRLIPHWGKKEYLKKDMSGKCWLNKKTHVPVISLTNTTKQITVVGLGYKHFGSVTNIRINFILNNKGMVQCGLYHKGNLLVMSERITEKPAVGTVLIPSRLIPHWDKKEYLKKDMSGKCWLN